MSDTNQPVFTIEKMYVKDMSLEVPNGPRIFLERENPEISIQLRTEGNAVDTGIFEVVVHVTVSAKLPSDKSLFLVEVAQAGIFQIRNVPQEDLEPIMMIGCANILYPYAREAVSDAVGRAGFQPVMLAPVNFEGLYQARKQEQANATPGEVPIQ